MTEMEWREVINKCLADGDVRMGKIENDLKTNTDATAEILEIVSTGKSFFRVMGHIGNGIKWIAGIAAACLGVYAAWKQGGSQ